MGKTTWAMRNNKMIPYEKRQKIRILQQGKQILKKGIRQNKTVVL